MNTPTPPSTTRHSSSSINNQALHYTHLLISSNGTLTPLITVSSLQINMQIPVLPPVPMESLVAVAEIKANPFDFNTCSQETPTDASLPNSQTPPKQVAQLPPSPPVSTPPIEEPSGAAAARARTETYKSHWQNVASSEVAGPPPGEKRQERCAFFLRKNGCRWGDDCRFLHDKNLLPIKTKDSPVKALEETWWRGIASSGPGSGSGSANPSKENNKPDSPQLPPGRIPHPTDPSRTIKTHCTFFLRFGQCDYWPCKYSHERPPDSPERKVFDWNAKNTGVILVESDTDTDTDSIRDGSNRGVKDKVGSARRSDKKGKSRLELRAKVVGGTFESRITELGINRNVSGPRDVDSGNWSSSDPGDGEIKMVDFKKKKRGEGSSEGSAKEEDELISF